MRRRAPSHSASLRGFPPPGRYLRGYSVPFQAVEYQARGVTLGQVTVILSYSSASLSG
jgi:hypothetical protein